MQHKKTDCYLPKLAIYFYQCYATRYRKLTADLGLTLRGLERPGLTGKRFFCISFSTSGGEISFAGNNDIYELLLCNSFDKHVLYLFVGLLHAL